MFAIEEGVFAVGRETEMTRFDWVRNQFRQRILDDLFGCNIVLTVNRATLWQLFTCRCIAIQIVGNDACIGVAAR